MDCDARGAPSRLWLRKSVDRAGARHQTHHYLECMNCGAHLKGRADGRMEPVDDDEWRSFVDDGAAHPSTHPPS